MKWLSLLLMLSLIGCAAVPPLQFYEYKYKLVEPIESDTLQYEDENVNISFSIRLKDVSFIILNKLNKPITLLYERAVYVDQFNLAHATIHSTLSLLTLETYPPPKVIPPKTALLNYFAPIEKIENIRKWKVFVLVEPFVREAISHSQWEIIERKVEKGEMSVEEVEKEKRRLLSELDESAKSNIGKRIGVFLPSEIEGKVENYFFKFEIADMSITQLEHEPAKQVSKIGAFVGAVIGASIVLLIITAATK